MNTVRPASVRAEPALGSWAGLAQQHFDRTPPDRLDARAALGLPTDRPIVMTGHQPGFWHPGILSKYIAADTVARAVGGTGAAVIVDHDPADPLTVHAVRYRAGRISRTETILGGTGSRSPARLRPAIKAAALHAPGQESGVIDADRESLTRVVGALAEHDGAASLAVQSAQTNRSLLSNWHQVDEFTVTRLAGTDAFERFFARCIDDPASCVGAYNRAVRSHPEAGVEVLFEQDREERWEIPFWLIDTASGRRPLYHEMVQQPVFDRAHLAPRALAMTACLRLDFCALFIHGTGGAV